MCGTPDDEEYRYLKRWHSDFGLPTVAEREVWKHFPNQLEKVIITKEDDNAFYVLGDDGVEAYPKVITSAPCAFYYEVQLCKCPSGG